MELQKCKLTDKLRGNRFDASEYGVLVEAYSRTDWETIVSRLKSLYGDSNVEIGLPGRGRAAYPATANIWLTSQGNVRISFIGKDDNGDVLTSISMESFIDLYASQKEESKGTPKTAAKPVTSIDTLINVDAKQRSSIYTYIPDFVLGIIDSLSGHDNIRIGGSVALDMHGLKLPNPPEDVDIIIYQPSSEQMSIIQALHNLNVYKFNDSEYIETLDKIVIGLEHGGKKVDILIDTVNRASEYNVSVFTLSGQEVGIQPVFDIIKAKKDMGRQKDIDQIKSIIDLNF